MLVTKKRLYTELCKVLDTVHGLITCVELEKGNRKSDKRELLERIDWIERWATNNLNKLDQRIDYVLDEIHALGELKPAKKKGKQNGKGNKKRI